MPSRTAPVHVGAGVTFVGIDDHVLDVVGGIAGAFPLGPRGEAAAAPAAQVGLLDFLEHLFGAHPGEGLGEGGVAADGEIVVDALGIDAPVGAEDDPLLVLVEGDVVLVDDLLVGRGVGVEQTLDDLLLLDGLETISGTSSGLIWK